MKKDDFVQKYEEMDPEEKKYEARRRIYRMVIMRVLISALLIWVIFWFHLPVGAAIFLAGVVVMILGTMVPVIAALRSTLKYDDEE